MGASRGSKLSSERPDRVAGEIYAGTPSENYGRYSFQSDYAPSRQSDYLGVARRYQAPSTSTAEEEEITTQEAAPAPAPAPAPKKENPFEALFRKSKEKKKTRQQMLDERLAQKKAEQERKMQLLRERTPFKNLGKKP